MKHSMNSYAMESSLFGGNRSIPNTSQMKNSNRNRIVKYRKYNPEWTRTSTILMNDNVEAVDATDDVFVNDDDMAA